MGVPYPAYTGMYHQRYAAKILTAFQIFSLKKTNVLSVLFVIIRNVLSGYHNTFSYFLNMKLAL